MIRWLIPLLLAPVPALAQQDCGAATTQMEMSQCAADSYQRADDELNAVYKQAAGVAKASGGEAPALLLAAQRAWIPYRDAACRAEIAPYDGGSIQPMLRMACMERLTRQRSADLRAAYPAN